MRAFVRGFRKQWNHSFSDSNGDLAHRSRSHQAMRERNKHGESDVFLQ